MVVVWKHTCDRIKIWWLPFEVLSNLSLITLRIPDVKKTLTCPTLFWPIRYLLCKIYMNAKGKPLCPRQIRTPPRNPPSNIRTTTLEGKGYEYLLHAISDRYRQQDAICNLSNNLLLCRWMPSAICLDMDLSRPSAVSNFWPTNFTPPPPLQRTVSPPNPNSISKSPIKHPNDHSHSFFVRDHILFVGVAVGVARSNDDIF